MIRYNKYLTIISFTFISVLFILSLFCINLFLDEDTNTYCQEYSNLDKIEIKIVNNQQYVLLNNEYISINDIKQNCLELKS